VYTLHDNYDGFFINIETNPIFRTRRWDPNVDPIIWYWAKYLYVECELKKLTLFDEKLLHLASAVIMFAAAIIPLYLSFRLKSNLRILTVLLSLFIFIHGIYHLAYFAGEEVLGEGLFRTISIFVLIIFGGAFIYMDRSKKEKLTVWWYLQFWILWIILHFICYSWHWEYLCGWPGVHIIPIHFDFKFLSSYWFGLAENSWLLYMNLDHLISPWSYTSLACRYM